MIWVVLGWLIIACAIVIGINGLVSLTVRRHKPEMSEPGTRTSAWQSLASSALLLAIGLDAVIRWVPSGAARWLLGIAGGIALIWLVRSDVAARRRSRQHERG